MQLFYAPDVTLPYYTLCEEESKHCVRVLRLKVGDELHLTDGRGNLHRCRIVEAHQHHCTVEVVETFAEYEKLPYSLTMAVAPTKNIDRFEWFLEKATEVGVSRIVPIECDHSERRQIKIDREEKVITAAVKQSLKAYLPTIEPLTPIRELLAEPFEGVRLIAHCEEDMERIFMGDVVSKGDNVQILIGPEGDFSADEVRLAVENGFEEITLGTQRFRTETAAVVAVDMVSIVNNL